MNGKLGDEMTVRIGVNNVQFKLLDVFFKDVNILTISPDNTPSVQAKTGSEEFTVPTSLVMTSKSTSVDIILKELKLKHDGSIFKYKYMSRDLTEFECNVAGTLKVVEELVSSPSVGNGASNIVVVWSGLLMCVVLSLGALFVQQ